jgi:gas vesicle protein
MRFLFGILIGFAVGFAGAILFAPQASPIRDKPGGQDATRSAMNDFGGNHHDMVGVQGLLKSLQEHLGEAFKEAQKEADEAEKEVHARFDEMVSEDAPKE